MVEYIKLILKHLQNERGYDFNGNRISMLERRITKRLSPTGCTDLDEYYKYIIENPTELNNLIDMLTINVSSFFRDPVVWEYIAKKILPALLKEKKKKSNSSLRVWSAGCASGEEPYSFAIILKKLIEKDDSITDIHIFGTDIDKKILNQAEKAFINSESVADFSNSLLYKYFTESSNLFTLNMNIREMVKFSFFDLLDKRYNIPPASIYGDFDIVFCRNLLIYFNQDYQNRILEKLYNSLNSKGFLILGKAEILTTEYNRKFRDVTDCCKIYQKQRS